MEEACLIKLIIMKGNDNPKSLVVLVLTHYRRLVMFFESIQRLCGKRCGIVPENIKCVIPNQSIKSSYKGFIGYYNPKDKFQMIVQIKRSDGMKKTQKSTLKILVPAILIELYFFYQRGFVMSEMFFFVWFFIFGTFFAFRWIGGSASPMGIGGGSRFMAVKFSETMFQGETAEKVKNSDFSLDLIFLLLAITNLILSLIAYYIER
jgi:hypothetical protein